MDIAAPDLERGACRRSVRGACRHAVNGYLLFWAGLSAWVLGQDPWEARARCGLESRVKHGCAVDLKVV